jgi:HAE1 family hydrophobic/amphiphilic exporter-1
MSAITRWVLQRRAATILITVLIIVLGVYATAQLQEELLPDVTLPYISVTTAYPGATSQVVADSVSKPIEAAATQIPGFQQVNSTSLQGYSLVLVQFEYGTDVTSVQQQLTTKLRSVALPTLANGSQLQPNVTTLNLNSQPIMYITVQGLAGQSAADISNWANTVASPEFSKVSDVGNVQLVGDTTQRATVTLNPARLATYGLSVTSVLNTLQAQGITFSAGTADIASQTVPVQVSANLANAAALGNIVVSSGAHASSGASGTSGGSAASTSGTGQATGGATTTGTGAAQSTLTATAPTPVRLGDVATITTSQVYSNGQSRTNGTAGMLLQVFKAQNGNTVKASDGALAEIQQLNKDYATYQLTAVYDQAQSIRDSISGLVREAILGAFFAVLVIFLFLRNVRSTMVTAISIPTSIVAALILLWTRGITLNTLTLGGLAIAVGRVVDDAIVVLENIYRHVQQGDPVSAAVRNGTREVASAITSSTVTTVAVFLPLAFVGGITGQFFVPFALTVTFALVASLVVALTVVPVFASALVKPRTVGPEGSDTLLQRIYTPVLRWGLGHRALTLVLAFVLFVGSIASIRLLNVPVGLLPNSNTNLLELTLSTPQGADQAVTTTAAANIENVLAQYKQHGIVRLYETTIAGDSSFARTRQAFSGSNTTATMLITLSSSSNAGDVANELRQDLQPDVPAGGGIAVMPATSFGGSASLSYIVQGPSATAVKQGSDAVLSALSSLDNIANLKSDVSAVTPQIVVTPDPTRSQLANPALIGSELGSLLQGQNAGTITFSDGTQSQILVQVPGPRGASVEAYIAALKQLPLGGGVRLGDVAVVQQIDGVTQVTRINQSLAATITATITTDNTGAVTQAAANKLRGLALPEGVTVSQSGVGEQQSQAFSGLAVSMMSAVGLVYIVMVLAFGSLLEPFAILFSLPLAAIGGLLALGLTHHELDISSLIGFLMLIGIVVTNAIVLMDLVNQLRRRGFAPHDALIQAGRTRLRPILMTAVATILALLPLALGIGGNEGGIIAADLGVVVIGGLLTSTLLTLVVVPVIYDLLDGARRGLRRSHTRGGVDPDEETVPLAAAGSR